MFDVWEDENPKVEMMIGMMRASRTVRVFKEESGGEKRICRRFWLQAAGRRIKKRISRLSEA